MNLATRILSAAVLTTFLGAALVSAQSATELQKQLQDVLQQINGLRGQLTTMDGPKNTGSCVTLARTLRKGSRGADVRSLQSFLAADPNVYPEGAITGTFGPATERAVQRFQERNGIVAYGDPFTTGFGVVGAKTRAVINAQCGGGEDGTGTPVNPTTAANVVSFNFTQPGGKAPFNAFLNFQLLDAACVSYNVDWGDNTEPSKYEAFQSTNCGNGITSRSLQHEFKTAGNYTVTLRAAKGPSTNMPIILKRTVVAEKGEPYVTMVTPAAGSAVRLGEYTKIKWDTGNYPSDSAIAFYMVGPSQTYSFAKRSMRSQEFDWIVGDRVCDGNSCEVQMPAGQYKIRAVMYTPADGCIDFCGADDTPAKTVITSESAYFQVTGLGSTGGTPITISGARGIAPYTVNVHVELAPTSTASNFEVDFGDGSQKYTIHVPVGETRATVRDVTHTYTKTGTYSVALRPAGAVQNIGVAMLVVEAPKFTVLPKEGALAPATVKATFDVDNSCVPQGSSAASRRYTIDWGDNTETQVHEITPQPCSSVVPGAQSISQQSFSHPYLEPGSRTVRLSVSNGTISYNASSTVNLGANDFTVSPSFFTQAPYNTKAKFKVDQSCSASGGATATYTVDWGDGSAPSVHSVTLGACSSTFTPTVADVELPHVYASAVGDVEATLTIRRSDVPNGSIIKKKGVGVHSSTTSFLWRSIQSLINGDAEGLTANANAAASSFYLWASGR